MIQVYYLKKGTIIKHNHYREYLRVEGFDYRHKLVVCFEEYKSSPEYVCLPYETISRDYELYKFDDF